MSVAPDGAPTLKELMAQASAAAHGGHDLRARSATSDLSIDEELVTHSIGYEPVELVTGTSIYAVPSMSWRWGQGEITSASSAFAGAFGAAAARLHDECERAGGHGVIGVDLEVEVALTHVLVTMVGTAIRPIAAPASSPDTIFLSDLSARDFALLTRAGWRVLGLSAGASFVYAPRRQLGATVRQSSQNIELTNFTEAIYAARESAMERMQASALARGAAGVVGVSITEGPMPFAGHAIGFQAWGTTVAVGDAGHQRITPMTVVSMDDPVTLFDITSLRR